MRKNPEAQSGLFNPRALIAATLCLLGVMFAVFSFASTPASSNITVPSSGGQKVTVTWTGEIPALVNGTSDCADLADTPVVDQHLPTIAVPAGVYNTLNAKFTFNISWDGSSGNDEILTVLKPDGSELASSDTGDPSETVTGNNLAAGTYKVIACGFVSGPDPQPYSGKLTIETSSSALPTPTPTPKPTPVVPGAARFQEYIPTDANGAPSASLGLIAGEPTMGVNTKVNANKGGDLFYQALFEILRIRFDDATSPARATWEFKDAPNGLSNKATLDPIFLADPSTGRLWATQLAGGDSLTDISDDNGETWSPAISGGIGSGADHQGMGVGPYPTTGPGSLIAHPLYPNAVYYCSQQVATAFCARSDNGGQSYGPNIPIYDSATSRCVGLHGHPKVAPDGTVYVPNKGCGLDTPVIGNGLVNMVVSQDAGMTWTIRAVPDSTGGLSSKGDPSVGIDKAGTVYLAYQDLDTNHMRVAVTHNKGATYSPSVDVGALAGINYSVFPAATAGDAGRAAVAFFGSTYKGANTNFEDMSFPGIWYLYVATTYDGGSTWHVTNTTPDNPIQAFGGIGNSGDNRNHYDFIDCQTDTQGRIIASNSIGCSAACVNHGGPNTFAKLAGIVRQSGGRRMYAKFDPVEPALPAAPLLTGYRTSQLVHLTWPDTDNGGSPITGYNVYRRIDGGAESKILSLAQGRQLSDPANAAHSYQYRVTAVTAQGEGPSSNLFAPKVGQNAPKPQLSCTLPGQLYTDRTGEGGTQPNNDIASFSIAEPQNMPGKLVFVINNAQPSLVENGNSLFYVYFDPPSGGIRYRLRYSADPSAPANEIGRGKDNDFTDDPTPETGGQFRNWTVIGELEAGSGIQPDGSVRFIVNKTKLGLKNGDVLFGVAVREDTSNSPSGVLAADYAGGRQDYVVVGNDFCTNKPPVAVLKATPASGKAPLNVTFDATGSFDPDFSDTITSYNLTFGDGSPDVSQGSPFIKHAYTKAGTYTAQLVVTDSRGATSTNMAKQVITVTQASPSPTPSATPGGTPSGTPTPTPTATPSPTPADLQLLNISGRVLVQGGDKVGIGGFIISGAGTKRIMARAIGPSIKVNGTPVPGTLQNPFLELHDSSGRAPLVNDNWRSTQEAEIKQTGLAPSDDRESAIVKRLPAGNYTAIIRGADGKAGIGLVELYDLSSTEPTELGNLSVRADVGTDDNVLIDGIILRGGESKRVLFRALGPSVKANGATVHGALKNPTLEVHDGNGALLRGNDDWPDAPNANEIQATGLAPPDNRESAVLMSLGAGNYTSIVRGLNRTTGIALSETYKLNN